MSKYTMPARLPARLRARPAGPAQAPTIAGHGGLVGIEVGVYELGPNARQAQVGARIDVTARGTGVAEGEAEVGACYQMGEGREGRTRCEDMALWAWPAPCLLFLGCVGSAQHSLGRLPYPPQLRRSARSRAGCL